MFRFGHVRLNGVLDLRGSERAKRGAYKQRETMLKNGLRSLGGGVSACVARTKWRARAYFCRSIHLFNCPDYYLRRVNNDIDANSGGIAWK